MFRPSHGALVKRRGWLPALEWWENRRFLGRTMNFTAKLALVLALLTLPVFGQSTGLPAPGVTAASCASGYFVTGVDNYYFLNAPNCNAWDITTPANLAYATMSTATPWVMTLHGTGTDVVKWHCDLVGQ